MKLRFFLILKYLSYTLLTLLIILAITAIYLIDFKSLGAKISNENLIAYSASVNFNDSEGRFVNRKQRYLDMRRAKVDFKDYRKQKSSPHKIPSTNMPTKKFDLESFLIESKEIKFVWMGHSTFMINLNGVIILIDPIMSKYASPAKHIIKRFQAPPIQLEELPEIDFIIISHDHYDHLDRKTIQYFKNSMTRFLTPLGVSEHLEYWGIPKERITALDWWESVNFRGIEFICTPSQHFSGRRKIYSNQTLWASWVIKDGMNSIFYSGDSGYDTHFETIGKKLGPFDLAFIENGQYNKLWKDSHLFPEESVQAAKDLKSKFMVPVHWGMFSLSSHSWYEPAERSFNLSKKEKVQILTPILGEIIKLNNSILTKPWWRKLETEI